MYSLTFIPKIVFVIWFSKLISNVCWSLLLSWRLSPEMSFSLSLPVLHPSNPQPHPNPTPTQAFSLLDLPLPVFPLHSSSFIVLLPPCLLPPVSAMFFQTQCGLLLYYYSSGGRSDFLLKGKEKRKKIVVRRTTMPPKQSLRLWIMLVLRNRSKWASFFLIVHDSINQAAGLFV